MRFGLLPELAHLEPPTDQDGSCLFSLIICEIENRGSGFLMFRDMQPAKLLSWWNHYHPQIEDLRAGLDTGLGVPNGWPADLDRSQHYAFLDILRVTLDFARQLGFHDPKTVLHVLAAAAQTFYVTDAGIRKRNLERAAAARCDAEAALSEARKREAAATSANFATDRYEEVRRLGAQDRPETVSSPNTRPTITTEGRDRTPIAPSVGAPERAVSRAPRPQRWPVAHDRHDQFEGGLISTHRRLQVGWASHIGPRFAHKEENQDAVHVASRTGKMCFALGDGVSTSFGARFAAAAVVSEFCTVAESIPSTESGSAVVRTACAQAQQYLDSVLDYLLDNPDAQEWGIVRGESRLAPDVIRRLMENTRNPRNRSWGPVFATTLIGGLVQFNDQTGAPEIRILRVGDGVVERTASTGEVESIFAMDSTETEITVSVSAGPQSRKAVTAVESTLVTLNSGEGLVISSDGLARGHTRPVTSLLRDITSARHLGSSQPVDALRTLKEAVAHAEEEFGNDTNQQLFADNLSIILISARER